MSRAALRRRLAALYRSANPAGSLHARVAALEPHERAAYERWQDQCRRWHEQEETSPGAAYAALLEPDADYPRCPPAISEKILGAIPKITADMDDVQAADVYNQYIKGE